MQLSLIFLNIIGYCSVCLLKCQYYIWTIQFDSSRNSIVGIMLVLLAGLERNFYRGKRDFSASKAFRLAVGSTQSPVHWLLGPHSPRVKRLGCEAQYSRPSYVDFKDEWSYTSTPQWHAMHRDNFCCSISASHFQLYCSFFFLLFFYIYI